MKIPHLYPVALMVALYFLFGITHLFSQTSLFGREKFINTNGDTLNYRLLISDADSVSRHPLVVFLHGAGENGDDNEAQLKWGVMNFASTAVMKNHRPIVIAPQCPDNMSWGNYIFDGEVIPQVQSTPTKPLKLVVELIDKLIADLPVDTNRIYITGLSMGGVGTFDAIYFYPAKFAAAVPVCGAADLSYAESISHIPIWMFQGALDPVISQQYCQDMVRALTELGAHPGFTQYPETGHFSWIAAYSDSMMMEWLFRQHK